MSSQFIQQEIENALEEIKTLDHYTMCYIWRFHPPGTAIYLKHGLPTSKAFLKRLFLYFGGFNT